MTLRRALIPCMLLCGAVALAFYGRHHMHDDVRRQASRVMGCPADEIEVEVLASADVERYRVSGCGRHGVMSCEPTDPVCFVTEE